jgi:capsular polysaccharide biosynthesis protein
MDSINSNIKYFLSAGVLKKLIKLIIKSNTKKLDKVVIFSGSLSDNKFHWLIDYLPRLQNIIENNQVNDFVFILNKNQIKFNEFYLEKLGILKKNFYYWDGNSIMIKKLYLFSLRYLNFRSNRYKIYSHSSIQWLKKTFDNKFENIEKNINYEKICILRKKNDSRSIVNDEEFKNFLKELNYKFIYLEDFTEEQIIQIFKSANILIAVHGASLANMIFSNNLKLIEIYPQSRPEEDAFVYYQISRILKFEHHLYLVDDNKKKEGIIINMKIFKEKLRNIL